ncbi:hexosyltransferase [Elysia marginata]|uniref:Hexosyltransferase n=1 Tax=Elysia marginata TaxID=1093978 RepID=A0AAV4IJ51_9GAST|nr:hexosyltransferase [Elysia marginata]
MHSSCVSSVFSYCLQVQGQVVNLTANLNSVNSQRKEHSVGGDTRLKDSGSSNNDKNAYLWSAGQALQYEENESEGRRWFGPDQKDFKIMESLGDGRRIAVPDDKPKNANNMQSRSAIRNPDDDSLQRDGRHGRVVAAKNDGNPLIDSSLRNRPLYNPGFNNDPVKYNFGPRQDFVPAAGEMDAVRYPDRGGAAGFPGRVPPRRVAGLDLAAADRRTRGLQDDRVLSEGASVIRMPRDADGGGDIVDKAEQIYIDPAVAQAAVVSSQNLGGGKDRPQQQKNINVFSQQTGVEDYDLYIKERMEASEILHGQPYKTEYEMISFNRFIMNRIYMVDPGLGKRVVEKPIGSKKKDINEVLFHAVEKLNRNRSSASLSLYTYDHFVEGIYRTEPASGAHYELYFTNLDKNNGANVNGFKGNAFQQQHHQQHLYTNSYVRVSMFRPFAPPQLVQQTVVNTGPDWINLVLPLSGRIDTFKVFMDQFVSICINQDRRIYLTVVYFGVEGLKEVKAIMSRTAKTYRFKHMKLVTLNETFARGRGLQIGTLNWKGGGDVLMFFCDVDIMFTPEFFERCRLNSEKGKRVYYPIVFSLYNPKLVYSLQDIPTPSLLDQLVLSKDTGFWRDFGYGMTCQYRSDFLKIKGFDEQITGWGGEDVSLYQKFVHSGDYFVVRATDPAIFHLWHEKSCDPNLSAEQYRSCIRSKALNEASHSQLGLLAFKDEIDVHRGVKERNKLLLRSAAMGGGIAAGAASNLDLKRKQQVFLLHSRAAKTQL